MGLRHPPKGYVPPVARKRGSRVVKFEEPEVGFFRRWLRRLTRPVVILPVVFLTAVVVGVLGYYYYIFSARIDRLLRGEVFTRTAGIYAAPKQLRAGETIAVEDLVARLRRAGYVERAQQADDSRGRYALDRHDRRDRAEQGLDDRRHAAVPAPARAVREGRQEGRGASTNLDGGARLQSAWLEPEQISSVTGAEREKRKVIGFADIPESLRKAIVTTEDRTFFDHYGINFRGILRALIRRYDADPNSPIARQGGSSITQQLVKNLLLSPEYSLRRKVAEAYMSLIIETRLSKEEIFALYCNEAYLGQRAGFSIKGFGEASEAYFNKDVTALTLPEAALLASLIRSPNRYNPYRHPQVATERRNQVLRDMAATGAITEVEAAQAMATELKVAPQKGRIDVSEAPYFVDYAQQQLSDMLADTSAAERLRIYTTVDMELQRAAYAAVVKQLAALDKVQSRSVRAGDAPGRARGDERADRRGRGDGRRARLREEPAQPRDRSDAPARLGLQAVRLRRRAQHRLRPDPARHHRRDHLQGRAADLPDQRAGVFARQLRRAVLEQGCHRARRARQEPERRHGRAGAGRDHRARDEPRGEGGPAEAEAELPRARARHERGDAAPGRLGLHGLRAGRQARRARRHQPRHDGRGAHGRRAHHAAQRSAQARSRLHHDLDDEGRGEPRHGGEGARARLQGQRRGQDRHLARRLVRRLHAEPRLRRLRRLRRRLAARHDGRRLGASHLGRLHDRRAPGAPRVGRRLADARGRRAGRDRRADRRAPHRDFDREAHGAVHHRHRADRPERRRARRHRPARRRDRRSRRRAAASQRPTRSKCRRCPKPRRPLRARAPRPATTAAARRRSATRRASRAASRSTSTRRRASSPPRPAPSSAPRLSRSARSRAAAAARSSTPGATSSPPRRARAASRRNASPPL